MNYETGIYAVRNRCNHCNNGWVVYMEELQCGHCFGCGNVNGVICPACNGAGIYRRKRKKLCGACGGTGKECLACDRNNQYS